MILKNRIQAKIKEINNNLMMNEYYLEKKGKEEQTKI